LPIEGAGAVTLCVGVPGYQSTSVADYSRSNILVQLEERLSAIAIRHGIRRVVHDGIGIVPNAIDPFSLFERRIALSLAPYDARLM
jgi:hypothetical protein